MKTFFNESPKCHLYRYIFDNNVLQFHLDRPINYIYKPYIFKNAYIVVGKEFSERNKKP
jgi:hypothetical protein